MCAIRHGMTLAKIVKLLARQENADLETLEESGLSLATVKEQHCVRVHNLPREHRMLE